MIQYFLFLKDFILFIWERAWVGERERERIWSRFHDQCRAQRGARSRDSGIMTRSQNQDAQSAEPPGGTQFNISIHLAKITSPVSTQHSTVTIFFSYWELLRSTLLTTLKYTTRHELQSPFCASHSQELIYLIPGSLYLLITFTRLTTTPSPSPPTPPTPRSFHLPNYDSTTFLFSAFYWIGRDGILGIFANILNKPPNSERFSGRYFPRWRAKISLSPPLNLPLSRCGVSLATLHSF